MGVRIMENNTFKLVNCDGWKPDEFVHVNPFINWFYDVYLCVDWGRREAWVTNERCQGCDVYGISICADFSCFPAYFYKDLAPRMENIIQLDIAATEDIKKSPVWGMDLPSDIAYQKAIEEFEMWVHESPGYDSGFHYHTSVLEDWSDEIDLLIEEMEHDLFHVDLSDGCDVSVLREDIETIGPGSKYYQSDESFLADLRSLQAWAIERMEDNDYESEDECDDE